jgi:hypothetical protein
MDRATRNAIERATQQARQLLEQDFASQLEGTYDILRTGWMPENGGADLKGRDASRYSAIVAAIERKHAGGMSPEQAVADYLRDAAFTALNRFVALKMLEERGLVQQCISKGEESSGYSEFVGMAPGIPLLPDGSGYRLYLESLFDELSTEVKVLFDRRDSASALWPHRAVLEELLDLLNAANLASVWGADETIGWVYQYFNGVDERKKMREESQAPRNSRELAIRNQFFTPRYVVQFLVENTLGRTWLEMYGEATQLVKRCEYLVRPVDEPIGSRRRKDPRDLRILDPACGSGHFLLYAFDLLLTIYEEAWALKDNGPISELTGRSLHDDYPDLPELKQAAPGLIVAHNLHGVDIDARCAQIAALALWLRAQRAYKEMSIRSDARPRIERTNIVIAEPMPESPDLAIAFAAELKKPFQRTLFERMIEEMRLAAELGTLLQVERSLSDDISSARRQFVQEQPTLALDLPPKIQQGKLDLSGVTDETVFREAEETILEALRRFAESAGGADARRRLFAGDAAQGVALIDLLRTRFDIVLMNPPFGAASLAAKSEFEKAYPRTKNDIYAAFVERGIELVHPGGLLGAITSRTGFFLSSFQKWREEIILNEAPPTVFADLGYGVMDGAMVEAAAYCLQKGPASPGAKAVFLRLLEADDKGAALKSGLQQALGAKSRGRFDIEPAGFRALPGSPFAYWAPDSLRACFERAREATFIAKPGLQTDDDFRFIRLSWEHANLNPVWRPLMKGGAFSRYYFDPYLLLSWRDDGWELKTLATERFGNAGKRIFNEAFYFRPGLTWPNRTNGLSVRALPAGCIFVNKGPAAFVNNDRVGELMALAAVTNSRPFVLLVSLLLARTELAQSFEVGIIQRTPVPNLSPSDEAVLASLAHHAWSLKRGLDTRTETSHAFVLPALLQVEGATLADRAADDSAHLIQTEANLAKIQAEIDERCFGLYGIDYKEREAIAEGFSASPEGSQTSGHTTDDGESEEDSDLEAGADMGVRAAELVSWAVGVAFGRFDVRLATGGRPLPFEPEPFDPLPGCSPGMLTGDDGLPLAHPPIGYPLSFPDDGTLVDDLGHPRDLTAGVRGVFETVFGYRADAVWEEVAALLDPRDHDLRRWLASGFFEHHLRRHSRSRRKAPILWQFGIPSGRYSVWCYAHRMTQDSLLAIQNDIVGPKLATEERRLSGLVTQRGQTPSARERADVATQQAFIDELRTLLDEIRRVAPLWNPDLDDGIVLVMAPLWRLVPTHKAWQRELRTKWNELVTGKYDWAHLAMHLWPERVVPKCASDRSLAIAHGLEDVFWAEGSDGKWTAKKKPTQPTAELVTERTSAAVKAALTGLVDSPSPINSGKRSKNSRQNL